MLLANSSNVSRVAQWPQTVDGSPSTDFEQWNATTVLPTGGSSASSSRSDSDDAVETVVTATEEIVLETSLQKATRQLEQLKMRNAALHMKTSEHMTNVAEAKIKAAQAAQAAVTRNS